MVQIHYFDGILTSNEYLSIGSGNCGVNINKVTLNEPGIICLWQNIENYLLSLNTVKITF